MLLAIDAGNTNVKLAVFQGSKLLTGWRLITDQFRESQVQESFQLAGINVGDVEAVIVASVVPQLNDALTEMSERCFHLAPRFVDHTTNTGLKILYDEPSELGADRIVDAVAAVEKYGAPCIVVNLGTATTFNAINSKREYLGGIIAPGLMTSAEALFSRAAKLPRVAIERPKNLIGTSTVDAMQSGLFYGYASLVDGLIERVREALDGSAKVIATGGFASLIADESKCIDVVDERLTLDGLRIIYEINKT